MIRLVSNPTIHHTQELVLDLCPDVSGKSLARGTLPVLEAPVEAVQLAARKQGLVPEIDTFANVPSTCNSLDESRHVHKARRRSTRLSVIPQI